MALEVVLYWDDVVKWYGLVAEAVDTPVEEDFINFHVERLFGSEGLRKCISYVCSYSNKIEGRY